MNPMAKSYLLLLSFFGAWCFPSLAAVSNVKVYTNPLPFFSEIDEQNRNTGYSVDLARLILQEAGLRGEFLTLPWARIMRVADQQSNAIILGLARRPEREAEFHWITPISSNAVAVFTRRLPQTPLTRFDWIDEFGLIAVLRDDYRQQILIDNGVQNMVTFNSWQQAMQSLLKGRVDSVFLSDMGVLLTCSESKLDCAGVRKVFTYQEIQSYIAVPKTDESEALAKTLLSAARAVKASADFAELTQTYLTKTDKVASAMQLVEGVISTDANSL